MSVSAPNCLSPVGCWFTLPERQRDLTIYTHLSPHALTCSLSITLLLAHLHFHIHLRTPSPICNSYFPYLSLSLSLYMSIYRIFSLICIPCTYLIDFSAFMTKYAVFQHQICTRSLKSTGEICMIMTKCCCVVASREIEREFKAL